MQFLKSFNVYFKIRFGNPAICPNIEIHQPFQVGVCQAKTSEGAPTPAVLLGLGYSQTPLTQFSCFCILTFFLAANHLWVWGKYSCWFGTITCHVKLLQVITRLSMCRWRQNKEEMFPGHTEARCSLTYPSMKGWRTSEVLWVSQDTQKWPALHHFIVLSFIASLAKLRPPPPFASIAVI